MSEHAKRYLAPATSRRIHVALSVAGTSGLVMSFFPFAFDYVPIRDVFPGGFLQPSWWSVLPCMLLPVPVAIGYGLWLTRRLLPPWYATGAYILAILAVGPFLTSLVSDWVFDGVEIIVTASFIVAFCAAAGLVVWGVDRGQRLASLVAMQAVYIGQIQFWLVLAASEFQAGAWLGAAAALVYLAQIILIAKRRAWLLPLLLPAAVLSIVILVEA
jgi:hypothetical protein